jgi:hypothetical protein
MLGLLMSAAITSAAGQDALSGGLPPVIDETLSTTETLAYRQGMSDIAEPAAAASTAPAPSGMVFRTLVGCADIHTYCRTDFELPKELLDADGGEIRLILQHETAANDELRTLDIHLGCEWTDNSFGARGRYAGRYCWGRWTGGGEKAAVLGDGVAEELINAWGWVWILDAVPLGGTKLTLLAHPHVTGRVFFYD